MQLFFDTVCLRGAQTQTISEMGKAVQAGLALFWDANRLRTVVTALIQLHLPLTEKELQVSLSEVKAICVYCILPARDSSGPWALRFTSSCVSAWCT